MLGRSKVRGPNGPVQHAKAYIRRSGSPARPHLIGSDKGQVDGWSRLRVVQPEDSRYSNNHMTNGLKVNTNWVNVSGQGQGHTNGRPIVRQKPVTDQGRMITIHSSREYRPLISRTITAQPIIYAGNKKTQQHNAYETVQSKVSTVQPISSSGYWKALRYDGPPRLKQRRKQVKA